MRTLRGAVIVLLLAGTIAGCGGGGETKTVTREVPAGQETATGGAEATATPEATTGADAGAIAEGEGSGDGGRFRFTIDELRRSGPTVVVNATVTWIAGGDDSIQLAGLFGDGVSDELESGEPASGDTFDGIALIDPEGRKKYLVARDSTGRCVCSADLNTTFVTEDTPARLEATLSAPPAEVTKVDVFVPRIKTFVGVPISG